MKQNLSALWSLRRAIARREARRPVRVCRYTLPGEGSLRLVHLTDLHLDDRTDWNALSRLVEQVNRQHPDVVVFTGDLVCHPEPFRQWKTAAEILCRIQAPCGVFAVRGNHDLFGAGQKAQRLFEKSGFVLLKNQVARVQTPSGTPVVIGGLDDVYFQNLSDPSSLLCMRYAQGIRIVLVHEPTLAKKVPRGTADLILAGHSHAGQVYAPVVWRAWMTKKVGHYLQGFYKVHGMRLYVSAGLGESGPGFRLFCPRELTIFDFEQMGREHF